MTPFHVLKLINEQGSIQRMVTLEKNFLLNKLTWNSYRPSSAPIILARNGQ